MTHSLKPYYLYTTAQQSGIVTHFSLEVEVSFGSDQDLDSVIMTFLTGNMECSPSFLYI